MSAFNDMLLFIERLEKSKIKYRINQIRDSTLIEVRIPGEYCEVEFFADGHIDVEPYPQKGDTQYGQESLEVFLKMQRENYRLDLNEEERSRQQ